MVHRSRRQGQGRHYEKIEHPKPVQEATEKYSGQVKLGPDKIRVENYVAGLPFPKIDADDPDKAVKHMFNYEAAIALDDLDLRNFDADTGAIGDRAPAAGRAPLPDRPLPPPASTSAASTSTRSRRSAEPRAATRYKETLYPMIEPFDLKGVGFTYNRYVDPAKQDDTWLYLPSLRRVRRLSTAQRSDALFGQDTDHDSYGGYAGAHRLDGLEVPRREDRCSASFHAENFPVKWAAGAADFAFDDKWEKRKVWVVEGVSKLPQYAYSKRVLYIDKESYCDRRTPTSTTAPASSGRSGSTTSASARSRSPGGGRSSTTDDTPLPLRRS